MFFPPSMQMYCIEYRGIVTKTLVKIFSLHTKQSLCLVLQQRLPMSISGDCHPFLKWIELPTKFVPL